MKNLINFILRNVHWLIFLFLLAVSVVLIIQNNQFQRSRYLSLSHEISGKVNSVFNSVSSYMHLRDNNAELLEQLALLSSERDFYKEKYEEIRSEDMQFSFTLNRMNRRYLPAYVVNNRIIGVDNYLTINKGSEAGIERDMGVISSQGIVGVVMNVSSHFARVIPLLNPGFRPSCKLKSSNYFGPMVWDGKDSRHAYLEELPRHVVYELGDTIVTSGYSTIFPEGLPVGVVVGSRKDKNDDYTSLKVELFTDFGNIREVMVVTNDLREEQKRLEEGGKK